MGRAVWKSDCHSGNFITAAIGVPAKALASCCDCKGLGSDPWARGLEENKGDRLGNPERPQQGVRGKTLEKVGHLGYVSEMCLQTRYL